jgi:hypothetical protein
MVRIHVGQPLQSSNYDECAQEQLEQQHPGSRRLITPHRHFVPVGLGIAGTFALLTQIIDEAEKKRPGLTAILSCSHHGPRNRTALSSCSGSPTLVTEPPDIKARARNLVRRHWRLID